MLKNVNKVPRFSFFKIFIPIWKLNMEAQSCQKMKKKRIKKKVRNDKKKLGQSLKYYSPF